MFRLIARLSIFSTPIIKSPTSFRAVTSPPPINTIPVFPTASFRTAAPLAPIIKSPATSLVSSRPFPASLVNFQSKALYVPLIRRCVRFPKLIPPHAKPPAGSLDRITIQQHRGRYDQTMNLPEETIPEAVMELKFTACASFTGSSVPKFKIHNLRASKMDNNEVHSVITAVDQAAIESAKTEIVEDLIANGKNPEYLKEIWYGDHGSEVEFWAYSQVKHSKYSKKDQINNYATLTYTLAASVLTGPNPLGEFLAKKGFIAGAYRETEELLVVLKEYFNGKSAYPTFIWQGDYPSLFEVAVLRRSDGEMIDHPLVSTVPKGKFLMRRI